MTFKKIRSSSSFGAKNNLDRSRLGETWNKDICLTIITILFLKMLVQVNLISRINILHPEAIQSLS